MGANVRTFNIGDINETTVFLLMELVRFTLQISQLLGQQHQNFYQIIRVLV